MQLVNLTPHAIVLEGASGTVTIQPSGAFARISTLNDSSTSLNFENFSIPVVHESVGDIMGLPAAQPDTAFIVSRIVAERCSDRDDLYFPTDLIRDDDGRVIGARALGSVSLDANVPEKLVLLCGGNPLPLLLATMTIRPELVVMAHTAQTRGVAERISDAIRDRALGIGVELLELPNGSDVQAVGRVLRGICGPWRLDYTGGTKAMATQARLVFGETSFGRPAWATYVDYNHGVIRHDDGHVTPLADIGMTLGQIARLHGVQLGAGPSFTLDVAAGHRIARSILTAVNANHTRADRFDAYHSAHDQVRADKFDATSGRALKEGEWLEWLTAELASTAIETSDDSEVAMNQHIDFGADVPNAELDVIVRVGSQVSLLTCGTTTSRAMMSELKLKVMEAMQRVRQLAGDKAQVGLVCLASEQQIIKLNEQLRGSATVPAVRIFGSLELARFVDGDISELSRWLGAAPPSAQP